MWCAEVTKDGLFSVGEMECMVSFCFYCYWSKTMLFLSKIKFYQITYIGVAHKKYAREKSLVMSEELEKDTINLWKLALLKSVTEANK